MGILKYLGGLSKVEAEAGGELLLLPLPPPPLLLLLPEFS